MALIQAVANDNGAGATTVTIAVASTTAGSTIVVGVQIDDTARVSSVTDNKSGGSQTYTNQVDYLGNSGQTVYFFTCVNTVAGITLITINLSVSAGASGFAAEEGGLLTTSNTDNTNTGYQTSGTTFTTSSATATNIPDVGYGIAGNGGVDTGDFAVTGGWVGLTGTGFTSGVHINTTDGLTLLAGRLGISSTGSYAFTGDCINGNVASLVLLLKGLAPVGIPIAWTIG